MPDSLRGRFVAPAGVLELRRVSPTMPINFTLPRQPRAEPIKNRLLLAVAGLAALLVFGTLGFLGYLTLQDADATVASLRADQELVDADISRYDIDVKKLAAVDEFEARQVVWLDELYEIADRIPDVEKVKVTLIDGKPVIVPKAPVRPGAVAANPKTLKPVPAASLKLVMRSTDGPMVQRIADAFKADKFYVGTTKADSAAGATGGRGQQYEFNTQILHRGPGDYLRRLGVSFPKRARDPDAPDDEQGGDS